MTGYGRGVSTINERQFICELRSYNHRFLELKLRLPWTDPLVETSLRQLLRGGIDRGVVWVSIEGTGAADEGVKIDWERARATMQALGELRRTLAIEEPVPLSLIAEA